MSAPLPYAARGTARVAQIVVEADKGDGERALYRHKFGENGGQLPRLDITSDKSFRVSGGAFRVTTDADRGQKPTSWFENRPPSRRRRVSRAGSRNPSAYSEPSLTPVVVHNPWTRTPIYGTKLERTGKAVDQVAVASPASAAPVLLASMPDDGAEHVVVGYANTRGRLIGVQEVSKGSVDRSAVFPREVVRNAVAVNAKGVLMAHNHPSGELTPSSDDHALTRAVRGALNAAGVELLDHVIVSHESPSYHSFREAGALTNPRPKHRRHRVGTKAQSVLTPKGNPWEVSAPGLRTVSRSTSGQAIAEVQRLRRAGKSASVRFRGAGANPYRLARWSGGNIVQSFARTKGGALRSKRYWESQGTPVAVTEVKATRRRVKRRPSPAQLRARAAFLKMVRARAKARKRVNRKSTHKRKRIHRRVRPNPPSRGGGHMARRKRSRRRVSHRKHRARTHRKHRSSRKRSRRVSRRAHRARRRSHGSRRRRSSRRRVSRRYGRISGMGTISNPRRRRRRRVSRHRGFRLNPFKGGMGKIVKHVVAAGVGFGVYYATKWAIGKIGALSRLSPMWHGVIIAGVGAALGFGVYTYFKSKTLGLVAAAIPVALGLYAAWKGRKELPAPSGAAAASSSAAEDAASTKGIGDFVTAEEAAYLPDGTKLEDPTTGEQYVVGDPAHMVGSNYVGTGNGVGISTPLAMVGGTFGSVGISTPLAVV